MAGSGATGSPARRQRSFSLPGLLAVVLGLELVANRIGARMSLTDLRVPRAWLGPLDIGGLFLFELASVLGVLLAMLGLLRFLAQPIVVGQRGASATLSRAMAVLSTVGFVVVALLGVSRSLTPRLMVYMLSFFTLLLGELVALAWPLTAGRGRLRLWLVLLVVAVALHLVWEVPAQLAIAAGEGGREAAAGYPRLALSLGEALAVTLAAAAPFCFLPARRILWPAIAGVLAAAASLALLLSDRAIAQSVAENGFGLALPLPVVGEALYAIGFGGFTAAVVGLLAERGSSRLRGIGLCLVGLSGYLLELPYQLAATVIGVLCILDSIARERDVGFAVEKWQQLMRRAAAWIGAREVTNAGPIGFEEMRARALLDGETTELSLRRVGGELARAELVVGHAPSEEAPPLSLHHRGSPRLGRRDGNEAPTGDAAFDGAFAIYDARKLDHADPVLADDLRPGLRTLVDGWLGVWPGRGARLRTQSPALLRALSADDAEGERALRERFALLLEVKRRGD